MKRFVEGEDRTQSVLLPEFLDDYVAEDNPARAIDVFLDELDFRGRGLRASCRNDGPSGLPSRDDAEDLRLRLRQPDPVEPTFGARNRAQRRDDVADGSACAGLQDDRRFSQGQRPGRSAICSGARLV
jgi:hypothetical protein